MKWGLLRKKKFFSYSGAVMSACARKKKSRFSNSKLSSTAPMEDAKAAFEVAVSSSLLSESAVLLRSRDARASFASERHGFCGARRCVPALIRQPYAVARRTNCCAVLKKRSPQSHFEPTESQRAGASWQDFGSVISVANREVDKAPTIVVFDDQHSNPMLEFASERPSTPRDQLGPASADVYSDLPLRSPVAARDDADSFHSASASHSWASLAMIAVALAAFGAGGYLYKTYSASPAARERSQATATRVSDDLQSSAHSPAGQIQADTRREEPAPVIPTQQASDGPAVPKPTQKATASAAAPPPSSSAATLPHRSAEDASGRAKPHAEVAEADSPSLSGEWSMNTRVESSRLSRYEGLRLAYHLRLHQVGNQVTGIGYKLRENERAVQTRTPITLGGEVEGDRISMTFREGGTRRSSTGKLVLDRESDDVLRGRFFSDAAQSTGVVEARR